MKFIKAIFSPTGGVKKCADLLMKGMTDNEVSSIDLSNYGEDFSKETFEKDDVTLIAVPVFEGNIPTAAIERILQLKANGSKAVLMAVYGNRAFENALIALKDVAVKAGFEILAAVACVAQHSIVNQIAANRPDVDDAAQLADFGKKISEKLANGDFSELEVPGKKDYKPAKNMGISPKTNSNCTNCGLCAKQCPVNAIDVDDCTKIDGSKCISCVRCIAVCPVDAKYVDKMILAGATAMLKLKASGRNVNTLYV